MRVILVVMIGHAVRRGRAQQGDDEEGAAGGHRDGVVGGEPVQVSLFPLSSALHVVDGKGN